MELVSIIVPIYKVEKYLNRCIESIVNQTYKDIEIILVDDGSPDSCPEICDRWAEEDSRIQVIHKRNGGISDARNAGMKAAKGDYIAILDSDDYIEPVFIEYLYNALIETGADMAECRYQICSEDSQQWNQRNITVTPVVQTGKEALRLFIEKKTFSNHRVWDKLYRRELLEGEMFAVGYMSQDILFSCSLFMKCKSIAVIDNVLYHWRTREGSASSTFIKQRIDSFEMCLRSLEIIKEKAPELERGFKVYCCSLCFGAIDGIQYRQKGKDTKQLKEATIDFRRKIHFTWNEFLDCTMRQKIKIICSNRILITPSLRVRHILKRT